MEVFCQCLQKQSVILQCDLTKEAYIPNIYLMSGDWEKEKQTHTLFGQIEPLASHHACFVHTHTQLEQNIFQLYPCCKDEGEANKLFVIRAMFVSCWMAFGHIVFFSEGDLCASHKRHGFILLTIRGID